MISREEKNPNQKAKPQSRPCKGLVKTKNPHPFPPNSNYFRLICFKCIGYINEMHVVNKLDRKGYFWWTLPSAFRHSTFYLHRSILHMEGENQDFQFLTCFRV